MRKFIVSLSFLAFVTTAPFSIGAVDQKKAATPAPTAPSTPASSEEKKAEKASRPLPFQAKVHQVNRGTNTFVTRTKAGKENVFHITEKTKILKNDAPATLADIKPDEVVRGSRIKLGDNKWEAVKVIIGAKPAADKGDE